MTWSKQEATAYHRRHCGTVSACLLRVDKERFKQECEEEGLTQHAVIKALVMQWMRARGANQ